MHLTKKIILLFLCAISVVLFSQNKTNKNNTNNINSSSKTTSKKLDQKLIKYPKISYGKMLKYASKLEDEGSYVNAVEYYTMALEKKPTNACILQKLSELNFKLRDYKASEEYTLKLIEKDPKYDKEVDLRFALCLKANAKYPDALREFEKLLTMKEYEKFTKKIENEITGCKLAMDLKKQKPDPKIEINPIKQINGQLQEYAPQILTKDNMIYSALLSDTALDVSKLKELNRDYTSKILFTHFDKETNHWTKPELLPSEINVPKVHIGNAFMSKNGRTIYYTQCVENNKLEMKCKIFIAEKKDGKWYTEELKSLNSKGSTNTQPSVYEDETGKRMLLFTSDRPGGKGGLDIYYAELNDNNRPGEPQNLAPINTFGDDITPFYNSDDKHLYFSSDGYPSLGGLDVFKVAGKIGKWDKIINLKYPYNSSVDDIYLKIDSFGNGAMVTNREGSLSPRGSTCCDDVWSIRKKIFDVWVKVIYASSKDLDRKPLNGVDNVTIDKFKKLVIKNTTEKSEYFYIKMTPGNVYTFNGVKAGFYPGIDSFAAPKEFLKNDTLEKVIYLTPIEKKRYVVENIYYAFDKSVVRPEYFPIMDSLMSILNEHPDLFLKIDGHTDARGTVPYNQALSERRCKAAAEYVLLKGLAPERIIMRGYSELVPLAPNETPSGEDDPANRAKNRRVEFKVLAPNAKDPNIGIEYRVNTPFGID